MDFNTPYGQAMMGLAGTVSNDTGSPLPDEGQQLSPLLAAHNAAIANRQTASRNPRATGGGGNSPLAQHVRQTQVTGGSQPQAPMGPPPSAGQVEADQGQQQPQPFNMNILQNSPGNGPGQYTPDNSNPTSAAPSDQYKQMGFDQNNPYTMKIIRGDTEQNVTFGGQNPGEGAITPIGQGQQQSNLLQNLRNRLNPTDAQTLEAYAGQQGVNPTQTVREAQDLEKGENQKTAKPDISFSEWAKMAHPPSSPVEREIAQAEGNPIQAPNIDQMVKEYHSFINQNQPQAPTSGQQQQQPLSKENTETSSDQFPKPPKPGTEITPDMANQFLQLTKGDKQRARDMARQLGWKF